MNRFTSGLVTGGVLGAVGLAIALSDRGARKKVVKTGKRVMSDAADAMDDVRSKIW